jgi:hypothetical protein
MFQIEDGVEPPVQVIRDVGDLLPELVMVVTGYTASTNA